MSTPPNGDQPWQSPGHEPAQAPPGTGYGQPSSPSYGKYGQGQALPVPPTAPIGAPWQGQQGQGQQGWGQPGYGQPQAWANVRTTLQPLGGLPIVVIVLSVLYGLMNALIGFLAPNQHQFVVDLRTAMNHPDAPAPTLTLASGSVAYRIVDAVGILVQIGVWVVTALWLTKARQNALVLRPGGQRRSEAWVWLGWIIPIVNFWFPKLLLQDTLSATSAALGERPRRTSPWWAAWIVLILISPVQFFLTFAPVNHALHVSAFVVVAAITTLALLLWIRLVRRISSGQQALLARQAGTTLQG